jgi:predicted acylesterase/phospholipase RssA
VARLLAGRATGVVFSGGGARAVANIGVLQALEERGVVIDAVGGTSLGAVIAGCAARGQPAREAGSLIRRAVFDRSPFDVTFPALSLASGRRVTEHLRAGTEGLDLEDSWRNVFAVSTNLTRGEVEVHRSGSSWRASRASFSVPGVYPPVPNEAGDLLVDGGLLDNLPVGIMRGEHHGISVIAVDVGRARDLTAGGMPRDGIASGWELLARRLDPVRPRAGAVGLARILMRLTELGSERSEDRGDLYIRPAVDGYGIGDFKAFDRLVELGYVAGVRALDEWIADGPGPSGSSDHGAPAPPTRRTA